MTSSRFSSGFCWYCKIKLYRLFISAKSCSWRFWLSCMYKFLVPSTFIYFSVYCYMILYNLVNSTVCLYSVATYPDKKVRFLISLSFLNMSSAIWFLMISASSTMLFLLILSISLNKNLHKCNWLTNWFETFLGSIDSNEPSFEDFSFYEVRVFMNLFYEHS